MNPTAEQQRCHVCGQRSMQRARRAYEYTVSHDGRPPVTISIPDLEVVACCNPECRPEHPDDTIILDDDALRRITEETYRQLGLLTPAEIRTAREGLGLTQQQFQELLGLGGNTLSRWENGHVYQSRALDRFLRVVFKSEQAREVLGFPATLADGPAARGTTERQYKLRYVSSSEGDGAELQRRRDLEPSKVFVAGPVP